ncbi:MAG: pilus assembly protein PilN [Clostridia bacterium]|jgi:Tfp pilus assembly protein PilN|nr:pilus assembly protein PilN [Clostridia bacterium]
MKDFNFFSPYLKEKRNKQLKKNYIAAVSSAVVIGLISFTALNFYQADQYNRKISEVESYISLQETLDLVRKYEDAKKNTELTKIYLEKVEAVDAAIKNTDVINTELLDKLNSVMPADAFLLSLSAGEKAIEMQYAISSVTSAAEIEHNLRALEIFEKVHINIINSETSKTVSISCTLKDVSSR